MVFDAGEYHNGEISVLWRRDLRPKIVIMQAFNTVLQIQV